MTDKEAKTFYNSAQWKVKRLQILMRDRYECQDCRKRLKDAVAAGDILKGRDYITILHWSVQDMITQ